MRTRGAGRSGLSLLSLLPLGALLLLAGVLPFFSALGDSVFHDFYGERSFAGLDNYRFLAGDEAFRLSFLISLVWAGLESLIITGAAYALAVLMFESPRLKTWVYAFLLVPWGIPPVISIPLWRMIIHGAGGDSILTALFGLRVNLLTDAAGSFAASVLVASWLRLPGAVFILYGALRKLPARIVDAARLDGAGRAALSSRIYVPLVSGSLLAVGVLEFAAAFKEFSVPFLLTGGGPPLLGGITERSIVGATSTLEVYVYELFSGSEDYGLAAAYATVVGAAVAALGALAFLLGRLRGGPPAGLPPGEDGDGGSGYRGHEGSRRLRRGLYSSRPRLPSSYERFRAVMASLQPPPRIPGPVQDALGLAWRLALALLAVLSALLLIYALLRTAFSGLSSSYIDALLPPYPTVENFVAVFRDDGLRRILWNTFVIASFTAMIVPLVVLPAAMGLRKARQETRALVFALVQIVSAAGGTHSLVPLFGLFRSLGLVDSYVPVIFVYVFHGIPFALFTASAFLESFPPSLEESAELEGAGALARFRSIILPLSLPAATAAAMSAFLGAWNGFLVPLFFLNDDAKYTISLRLYSYVGGIASGAPAWGRFAAASALNLLVVGLLLWGLRRPLGRAALGEHEE